MKKSNIGRIVLAVPKEGIVTGPRRGTIRAEVEGIRAEVHLPTYNGFGIILRGAMERSNRDIYVPCSFGRIKNGNHNVHLIAPFGVGKYSKLFMDEMLVPGLRIVGENSIGYVLESPYVSDSQAFCAYFNEVPIDKGNIEDLRFQGKIITEKTRRGEAVRVELIRNSGSHIAAIEQNEGAMVEALAREGRMWWKFVR